MTTILAAAAVVMFAILIGVCVFGFLRLYALLKEDDQKDEVKAQPGKYRNIIADFDITSMHPSSCISEEPFSYRYSSLYKINKQDDTSFRVNLLEAKIDNRIEKLEKLVRHLYLERDEDMNEIENSVIDPYFKNKFKNDKQLDTNEDSIE